MASGSPSSSPDTATGSGTDPARPDTGEPLGGAGSDSDSDLGLSKFDCSAVEMTEEMEGEELEQEFESAADRVRDLIQTASRDQLLYLYARFKQVKVGKCNTPKPGFFDFEGQRKWLAWKQLGDMDAEQAMREYITCVNVLDPEGTTKERRGAERRTGFGGAAVSSLYQEEETIRAALSCTGPVTEDTRSWCLCFCSTKQTSTVRIMKDRQRYIMVRGSLIFISALQKLYTVISMLSACAFPFYLQQLVFCTHPLLDCICPEFIISSSSSLLCPHLNFQELFFFFFFVLLVDLHLCLLVCS
uniref:Acyl-CoA binding domain containing 6 n=1 Tax=Nothobranchius furzeri TaxID=105023 RepID=A0A8C6Q7T3_NOTFU